MFPFRPCVVAVHCANVLDIFFNVVHALSTLSTTAGFPSSGLGGDSCTNSMLQHQPNHPGNARKLPGPLPACPVEPQTPTAQHPWGRRRSATDPESMTPRRSPVPTRRYLHPAGVGSSPPAAASRASAPSTPRPTDLGAAKNPALPLDSGVTRACASPDHRRDSVLLIPEIPHLEAGP